MLCWTFCFQISPSWLNGVVMAGKIPCSFMWVEGAAREV
jgi:hypothetical protein